MAEFCVTIADADVERVITAMCANYGYQAQIPNPAYDPNQPEDPSTNPINIPNTETRNQFSNRMTRDFLTSNTTAYELKKEKEAVPTPTPPTINDPN
jgi:hypothetical protein